MAVTVPTPQALPEELAALPRRMRLPYQRAAAPDVLATARAQRWDPAEACACCLPKNPATATRPRVAPDVAPPGSPQARPSRPG